MMRRCDFRLIFVLLTIESGCQSCKNGDLQLVEGFDKQSGRVEFCHDGVWGTVCDDYWDNNDALVVCRQLGLPTDNVSSLVSFGGGRGSIFLDDVACNGTELRLDDCSHRGIGEDDCQADHREDAGVICAAGESECVLQTTPSGEEILQEPISRTCLQRYGHCIPFRDYSPPTGCDEFYTSEVDYIYVPNTRYHGQYTHITKNFIAVSGNIFSELGSCSRPIRQIFCYYYLTPCGNSTVFQLPKPVCNDTCYRVQDECRKEWTSISDMYSDFFIGLENVGITFPQCNDTGKDLRPFPLDKCATLSEESSIPTESGNSAIVISVAIISPLVLILLLTITLIVSLFCILKRKRQRRAEISILGISSNYIEQLEDDYEASVAFSEKLTKDLLISRHAIHIEATIGQGEFGIVYKATLNCVVGEIHYDNETVAVKTLKAFSAAEQNHLIEESLVMTRFDHLNVMKLIGVSPYKRVSLYIVMPYMIHGSLLSYLRNNRASLNILSKDDPDLVNDIRLKLWSMCLQISKGMEYLASLHFVHRDLAVRNCMIDDKFVIKVADFGLTEEIYSRNYFRQPAHEDNKEEDAPVRLPVKWMALESLNDGIFSEKTDVWSFGVTCWEVFSLGKMPYPGMGPRSVLHSLERGERLEKPDNKACSDDIYSLMKDCWNETPKDRPTFSELVTSITETLGDISPYLELVPASLTSEHIIEEN